MAATGVSEDAGAGAHLPDGRRLLRHRYRLRPQPLVQLRDSRLVLIVLPQETLDPEREPRLAPCLVARVCLRKQDLKPIDLRLVTEAAARLVCRVPPSHPLRVTNVTTSGGQGENVRARLRWLPDASPRPHEAPPPTRSPPLPNPTSPLHSLPPSPPAPRSAPAAPPPPLQTPQHALQLPTRPRLARHSDHAAPPFLHPLTPRLPANRTPVSDSECRSNPPPPHTHTIPVNCRPMSRALPLPSPAAVGAAHIAPPAPAVFAPSRPLLLAPAADSRTIAGTLATGSPTPPGARSRPAGNRGTTIMLRARGGQHMRVGRVFMASVAVGDSPAASHLSPPLHSPLGHGRAPSPSPSPRLRASRGQPAAGRWPIA